MFDETRNSTFRGIARLENELLVRDFIEVMNGRDVSALTPFLHREVQYQGRDGQAVLGSRAVLALFARFVQRFPEFEVRIHTINCVEQAVLVDETLRASTSSGRSATPAFAAFLIKDYQIIGWNQLFG